MRQTEQDEFGYLEQPITVSELARRWRSVSSWQASDRWPPCLGVQASAIWSRSPSLTDDFSPAAVGLS